MMRIAVDSEFERKNALLNLQRNRDEEDPIKACLKAKEANEIAVKEGKMTPEEFREANRKADDEKLKLYVVFLMNTTLCVASCRSNVMTS